MRRALFHLLPIGLLIAGAVTSQAQAATGTVDVLHVKGTINPVLVDYIKRGIEHAEDNHAIACIIQIDTPGGLDTSMRDIVQEIVNARVPVVVYVSPSGARAASAGVFITIAAHVAAMAPNTAIGAAHPVSISNEGELQMTGTMEEKVVNDAAAYIRSIAQAHGRNMEWAEKAVRESVSATEQEALNLNVIDLISPNLDSLITQLDGWKVITLDGQEITLNTKDASVNEFDMNTFEKFVYTIADPNIAYILLSLGILGLTVEIYNPGLVFPGVAGGICLLLALCSLGVMPLNYAGILLIILAFGLFVAELYTHSFGLLTAGGLTALVLGSLILFKGGPLFRIDPWLITTVTILIAGFLAFAVQRVIRAHRQQAYTGEEALAGKTALVKTALKPEGMVLYKGELWTAVSQTGSVEPGEEVIINRVDGLKLYVSKNNRG